MRQQPMTVWHYLLSRDARITIITPIVLYNLAFWWGGAGIALLVTALYSGVVELLNKRGGSLSVIALILVSGFSHYLYLHGYAPFAIKKENVFLAVSGALSVVGVFGFYSLVGRPMIRTLAEQAMPMLKSIPAYGTPQYAKVWHEVSLAWILVFLLKAVGVYVLSQRQDVPVDTIIFMGGWPLTLLMVLFSFYWPKYRWTSHRRAKGR
ncbi:Uncharacterised protein [Serratia quinivorans]|uniref:hypothetical protein n=1 Tax=Serratia quinivorans TaxID=137545 RepID=UPI00217C4624|nr:hypothetical protein [Serratia quinivorans]CAI1176724.1 Uncharacterised protein [Serratia quinivorans]CAI1937785.1 Uncharacterised protein [Serratia quinivorans]CAI1960688.1 Uncharacterised protein [Serratia quinivorans]CAI1976951.1 Uncharacterised protein [Serratia quinivorans]